VIVLSQVVVFVVVISVAVIVAENVVVKTEKRDGSSVGGAVYRVGFDVLMASVRKSVVTAVAPALQVAVLWKYPSSILPQMVESFPPFLHVASQTQVSSNPFRYTLVLKIFLAEFEG